VFLFPYFLYSEPFEPQLAVECPVTVSGYDFHHNPDWSNSSWPFNLVFQMLEVCVESIKAWHVRPSDEKTALLAEAVTLLKQKYSTYDAMYVCWMDIS
jgi:hypothetical protein